MLNKQTLSDQVCEYLRKKITNVELKPGTRIEPNDVAKELGVSVTPVREALYKLSQQGLIVVKPYVGFFVASLSSRDIEELFDLRRSLELLALDYVMRNPDVKRINQLLEKANYVATKTGEELAQAIREFDEDFHVNFLIKSSGNAWLSRLANGVIDLIKMTTRMTLNPYAASKEHIDIIETMVRGDLNGTRQSLIRHLERAKNEAVMRLSDISAGG